MKYLLLLTLMLSSGCISRTSAPMLWSGGDEGYEFEETGDQWHNMDLWSNQFKKGIK